jgi:HemY protein
MIRIVLYVVLLAAAISVAVWFANNPGEVLVLWRGWRIDTSVGILLVVMAGAVVIMLGLAKLIALIRGSVDMFATARKDRRLRQGLAALGHGFAAVHAGQPQLASKLAKEAAAFLDDTPATRLLLAQAAAANDDGAGLRTQAIHLLDKPETELAALRQLSARAVHEGDVVGALNYAKRALARKDAPKWALDMVLDVQVANGRWADALSALDSKIGRGHFGTVSFQKLKAELLTRMAEEALDHGDAAAAESHSHKALEAGGDERAVIAHARAMMVQTKTKKAAAEIEKAWNTTPSAALLRAYLAACASESALDQARRVEKLVAATADHAESRLALAEVSLKAQLWGQARSRLAPLLGGDVAKGVQARAAMLMAELETTERNDAAAGASWLKRALERAEPQGPAAKFPRNVEDLLAGIV